MRSASSSCFLAGAAFLSGLPYADFVLLEWPHIPIWLCYSKNFLPPIWLLWILQMTEKTDVWKNTPRCLWRDGYPTGHRKDKESASYWTNVQTLFPQLQIGVQGQQDQKSVPSQMISILCVFCFSSALTKWFLSLLHGSCFIPSWTISFFIRTIPAEWSVGHLCKSNSITTFKYWLVWE